MPATIPTFTVAELLERVEGVRRLAVTIVEAKAEVATAADELSTFDLADGESSRYMGTIYSEIASWRETATNEMFEPADLLERVEDAIRVLELNLGRNGDAS
jgi:hypothetical protein